MMLILTREGDFYIWLVEEGILDPPDVSGGCEDPAPTHGFIENERKFTHVNHAGYVEGVEMGVERQLPTLLFSDGIVDLTKHNESTGFHLRNPMRLIVPILADLTPEREKRTRNTPSFHEPPNMMPTSLMVVPRSKSS